MHKTNMGLLEPTDDMVNAISGGGDVQSEAVSLIRQSADIALLCSFALDSAYDGSGAASDESENIIDVVGRLLHKVWDATTTACYAIEA